MSTEAFKESAYLAIDSHHDLFSLMLGEIKVYRKTLGWKVYLPWVGIPLSLLEKKLIALQGSFDTTEKDIDRWVKNGLSIYIQQAILDWTILVQDHKDLIVKGLTVATKTKAGWADNDPEDLYNIYTFNGLGVL